MHKNSEVLLESIYSPVIYRALIDEFLLSTLKNLNLMVLSEYTACSGLPEHTVFILLMPS